MHRRRALRLGVFTAATHSVFRDIKLSDRVSLFDDISEVGSCFMYRCKLHTGHQLWALPRWDCDNTAEHKIVM